MLHGDSRKTTEVTHVEGEEMGDTVHAHRGNEPGVVYLHTSNGVGYQKAPPLEVDGRSIEEEREATLDKSHPPVGLGHCQAKASSSRYRAGADVPELAQNLGGIAEAVTPGPKGPNCAADEGMKRILALEEPKQDVRVRQIEHQS
jgi:hypothetical protein